MSAFEPSKPSQPSDLHALVHGKFREAFGDPSAILNGGEQWSISVDRGRPPIHVLLNGLPTGPSVWVFDPTNPSAAKTATHAMIKKEAELEAIIADIRQRMPFGEERAAKSIPPVSEAKSLDLPAKNDSEQPPSVQSR